MSSRRAVPLHTVVEQWLAQGVISPEQAARMKESGPRLVALPLLGDPRVGRSMLAEGLGYVGGAVVVAGASLLTAHYWEDLSTAGRVSVLFGAALLTLLAGGVVPPRPGSTGSRLRAVLWLASTVLWAGATAVLVDEAAGLSPTTGSVVSFALTAAYAGALWWRHSYWLQQCAFMVSVTLLVAAVIDLPGVPGSPGLGVWGVGLMWVLLGLSGVLVPEELPLVLGSLTAVIGAMTAAESDLGMTLTLVTVAAVVVGALVVRDLLLLAVGAVGALVNVPAAMSRWFPDSVAAPLALVVVGATLIGAAAWTARRTARG